MTGRLSSAHSTGGCNSLLESFDERFVVQGYAQVFSEWLCDAAALDGRVVSITLAMREGSGMVEFEKRFPDRYFDVGIAEQHVVTFATGRMEAKVSKLFSYRYVEIAIFFT
jgi:deoxyxylulose-5-phosphate synthase